MNPVFSRKALKALQLLSCSIIASFSLNGCGGGGGSSSEPQVAPASLENVVLSLFNAFTLEFSRLAGSAGNESGAAKYTLVSTPSFIVGISDTNNSAAVGLVVQLPNILNQVNYTYIRNSPTTGRITLTWSNPQVYPTNHIEATAGNPSVGPFANLFWGGPGPPFTQTSLVLDVLFVDSGGFILNNTVRLRSATRYESTFPVGGPADTFITPFEFDSTNAGFTLVGGSSLPTGYNPDITPETPSSAVWPTLSMRTINFNGNDVVRKIANQTAPTPNQLTIPGETVEDAGNILVDVGGVSVNGGGIYAYTRTGGSGAKVAIQYSGTVNVLYTLTFTSGDGGTFFDSNGASGTFVEDRTTNL